MNEFVFGTLATLDRRVAHLQREHYGVHHRNQLSPRAPRPGDSPILTVTVELPYPIERVVCHLSQPEPADLELRPAETGWDLLNWSYYCTWQVTLPPQPAGTIVRYRIVAYPADGQEPVAADDGATFSYLVGNPGQPDWAAEAIIYQVFPERFYHGQEREWLNPVSLSGFYGGTIRGIVEKLDYIADLGFNCIWLNPFFPDDTHHGYHATDYFAVNPRLGSDQDIRDLVQGAHQRGMRVLLDFVANHWSRNHATFQAALADRESEYYNWYYWIDWPRDYETFFGVMELPKINVDYPPARAHLLDAARYWLTDFDFDGYRLDYALGPSHDFWTDFRAAVKAARPDAWIFGEVVDTPAMQLSYEGRMDGCLDFVLMQALRDVFAWGTTDVAALDAFLSQHEAYFPPYYSRPSFLDNHDINRFLWLVKGDTRKLKLASLCQFTLSGAPVVYYGTEVGVSQERDIVWPDGRHIMEESRQPMLWEQEQDKELHAYYRWLIHLRRQHPALWHGRRQTVHLDASANTYAYTRSDGRETLLVALNLSDAERTIEAAGRILTLPAWGGEVVIL
jgi:cyclomaltodextrinase